MIFFSSFIYNTTTVDDELQIRGLGDAVGLPLLFSRSFGITSNNFDFISRDVVLIKFEIGILNYKSPNFITETISMQMALRFSSF